MWARCRRDGTSPDRWKRADLALAVITGTTITLDVRTTNTQCASAASSAAAHLHNLERAKIVKYADYYSAFRPFVIDLGGAVSEVSSGALKSITNEAAKASGPRLHWESFDWAVRLQRRIAVAMVRDNLLARQRTSRDAMLAQPRCWVAGSRRRFGSAFHPES